jgi:hypothetical protein
MDEGFTVESRVSLKMDSEDRARSGFDSWRGSHLGAALTNSWSSARIFPTVDLLVRGPEFLEHPR